MQAVLAEAEWVSRPGYLTLAYADAAFSVIF